MSAITFPDGFLWGSATSAHQIEGENTQNDWWAWEQAGRVRTASGLACDHYRRFRDDVELISRLGHTAYRFSVEWSRIEPAQGQFDAQALAHDRELVDALRQRGITPIVTLHHFTNPLWLARAGGWTNPSVIEWFSRYTEQVADALGDRVRYWLTINEPMVYIYMHHLTGEGPPGASDPQQAMRVLEHLIRAHAASYRILHQRVRPADGPVQVSVASYLPVFVPCRPWWPLDRVATLITDRMFNAAFLDAVTQGRWALPGAAKRRISEAKGTLDFLGVNYYRRHVIRFRPFGGVWAAESCDVAHHRRHEKESTSWMHWGVHPESFFVTLTRWAGLGLPILVTENGTPMADDARRWSYIYRHLQQLARALEAGAQIFGYCYWSLMDNYEWSHGFRPRFGLVEVDYRTQERRPRASALKFAEVCRTNRLVIER